MTNRFIGIGRSSLNFPKSVPMAGYSVGGTKSKGKFNDLTATCFNIDELFFLVSVDLMGLSCLLVQSVVEKCRSEGYLQVTRQNIIISAIHTHTAPGGFFDSDFYNGHASCKPGFIKQVFDFLVEKISEAVMKSIDDTKIFNKITNSSIVK